MLVPKVISALRHVGILLSVAFFPLFVAASFLVVVVLLVRVYCLMLINEDLELRIVQQQAEQRRAERRLREAERRQTERQLQEEARWAELMECEEADLAWSWIMIQDEHGEVDWVR